MNTSQETLKILDELGIEYQNFTHPAVYTCEESQRLCPPMPGKKNKNLFLRDRKGKHYYLISLEQGKRADLKQLSAMLGVSGLSFASERRLMNVLGVEPGSVGILSLLNDTDVLTDVWIDQELLDEEWLQSHPIVNTETSCFKTEQLENLLKHSGHTLKQLRL
jgi:Ala-tRNA(Pro) deacylase